MANPTLTPRQRRWIRTLLREAEQIALQYAKTRKRKGEAWYRARGLALDFASMARKLERAK